MAQVSGADLDGLANLSQVFRRNQTMLQTLARKVDADVANLQGLWRGPDASAFQQQWQTQGRQALGQAAGALTEVAETIDRNRAAQEATSVADGATGPPVDGAAGGRPVAFRSEGGAPIPEAARIDNTDQVFDEDYFDSFLDREFEGAESAELNDLLETVLLDDGSDPEALNANLDRIAEIRGVDPAEFRGQYDYYLELAAERDQNGGSGDFDLDRHPDHLGTLESLRSGAVVGDSLGIDPVFGALLSPSGGIPGPGDDAYDPGPNDAIGVHSAFHDASGYLLNNHGVGPGYDYLGLEPWADPTNGTFTGQSSGIAWWIANYPELDVDIRGVDQIVGGFTDNQTVIDGVGTLADHLHHARFEEVVGQVINSGVNAAQSSTAALEVGQGLIQIAHGDVFGGASNIYEGGTEWFEAQGDLAHGTVDNYWDYQNKQVDLAVAGAELVGDGAEFVVDVGTDAGEAIVDVGTDAGEAIVDVGTDAGEAIVETGGDVVDAIDDGLDLLPNPVSGIGGWLS